VSSAAPLVTICVPTFDRAQHVERLLASLAAEIGERDEVVVLVADNASPDRTPEVLRAALARHPWLRAHRQAENLGPFGNLEWLIEHAPASAYLWLFGDDDLLVPGSLAGVLELLRAEQPAWLFLPHRWVDERGRDVGGSAAPERPERHADARALYRAHHHFLTFITASIVRREPLRAAVRATESENAFRPLLWFLRAGADGPCVVAPGHVVLESLTISWSARFSDYMTSHFLALWDEGVHAAMTEDEFGTSLDWFYRGEGWALEAWRGAPLDLLERSVRRFCTSQVLRDFLWTIARERGDREALEALADERREAEARVLIADGERAFAAGRPHEAAERFHAATRLAPLLAEAWNDLAVALHHVGHPGAVHAVEHALFVAPDDADALANRDALLAG
jgi:hypothetical protein